MGRSEARSLIWFCCYTPVQCVLIVFFAIPNTSSGCKKSSLILCHGCYAATVRMHICGQSIVGPLLQDYGMVWYISP